MNITNHEITLRRFAGFNGGEKQYSDISIPARCVSENSGAGGNGRKEYLLPGVTELPVPGDRILDDGRERDITEVKVCRDITGNIRAVKCSTLN